MRVTLAKSGRAQVFGEGRMPIDFVSVRDVAALVHQVLHDPALDGRTLEIGGERHTMTELAEALSALAGATKPVRHLPRRGLRLMSVAARPVSPFLARVAQMALVMDTVDLGSPPVDARQRVAGVPFTTLEEVLAGLDHSAVTTPAVAEPDSPPRGRTPSLASRRHRA